MFRNYCSVNFCSLSEAIDSGYGQKSTKEKSLSNIQLSQSLTASCLVQLGLFSAERANWSLRNWKKQNAVLGFLRDQGFSKTSLKTKIKIFNYSHKFSHAIILKVNFSGLDCSQEVIYSKLCQQTIVIWRKACRNIYCLFLISLRLYYW